MRALERKFTSVVGATPKWAELRGDGEGGEDADSDDEFFRVRKHYRVNYFEKCK